jgi:hypothetical protein
VLEGRLRGETVTGGLDLGRPGHPASASGFFSRGREERNLACILLVSLSSLVSISTGIVLRRREHADVTDGVVLGTRGGDRCGTNVFSWGCQGSRP